MHDTGSISTFEKYVLSNNVLDQRQMDQVRKVQEFLRTVSIERTQEEVALMLKLLDVNQIAGIIAAIRAQWKIALPKPRVFNIPPDRDEALQKSLVAKGPDMARKVVECRKINEALKKFGLALSVAEVLIAKGYYLPPELAPQGPVLRPAETDKLEPAPKEEKKTPTPRPAPALARPAARRRDVERPQPARDPAQRQKIVFLASLAGIAACIIAVLAVVLLGGGGGGSQESPSPVALKSPSPSPTPAPSKAPEPKKPISVDVLDPSDPKEPPRPTPTPAPVEPSKTPEPTPAPAVPPPTDPPTGDAPPVPPPADPPAEPDKPKDADPPKPADSPTPEPEDKPAPADVKAAKRAEREAKAEKAWETAQRLVTEQKWAEALDTLRQLREQYSDTLFYGKNSKEINENVMECGHRVAAAGLQKQTLGKKFHIDTILGFQFNPPEGWRGIPNWQDIFGQRDTSEQKWAGESYRCGRYTSRWLETVFIDVYKTYWPGGPDAVCEGATKIYRREYEGLKEVSSVPWPHPKYAVIKRIYQDADGNRFVVYAFHDPGSKKGFGLIGYWKTTSNDILSWLADVKARPCDDKDWESAVKLYDQVAKSFVIMDQVSLSQARAQAKGSPIAPDGWYVKCADFNVLATQNYVIEYATRKDFAERLGRELENILGLYKRVIPSAKAIEKGRVKLFDCEEDFLYYGQAYGAAAYWSPWQREIVAYRFEGRKVKVGESKEDMTVAEERNPEEVTFNIIYHEAFHQYMENIMGISRDVYVPSWLNEGMGDYFFGGRWTKSGKFEIGVNDWRLETIVEAVKKKKHVPLKTIITYTQQQYYSNAGLCYAEGWAICYFFQSEEGRKRGYHMIAPAMFQQLKTSGDYKKATDKVFAGLDLKKMDEEFQAFVLTLEKFLPKKPDEEKPQPAKPGDKPGR